MYSVLTSQKHENAIRYYFGEKKTGGIDIVSIHNRNPQHPFEVKNKTDSVFYGSYYWAMSLQRLVDRSNEEAVIEIYEFMNNWYTPEFKNSIKKMIEL